ncbi:MAG TPA: tripartite tricarboxylate transporter substrate-binding protein [Alphaproteobacteria bacterium]|jgi:tripartite-type tricarboxylate transporter receptor subunit TctC|nr:tripartite tricarboxylate transporter substrate-binding protein [Alphaproteobacteria bacterium]
MKTRAFVAALGWLLATAAPGAATDFYDGKRINIIVGFASGGSADGDARVISRYLGKHIPGNPTIIVQNMPGAGGLKAINLAYQGSTPDGLTIYQLASAHYIQQLVGSSAVQFDLSKMPILGAWTRSNYVLVVSSKYRTLEDMRKAKEPLIIGSEGMGSGTYVFTIAWQRALGLKFKLITGYGSAERTLAVERGEIEGRTETVGNIVRGDPQMRRNAPPRVQSGTVRSPLMPDVPTVYEVNPKPGPFFEAINEGLSISRPYVLSPGTPEDRLAILRTAWEEMLKDQEFKTEVEKQGWEFVPTPYDKVEKFYKKAIADTPADVKEELKALFP